MMVDISPSDSVDRQADELPSVQRRSQSRKKPSASLVSRIRSGSSYGNEPSNSDGSKSSSKSKTRHPSPPSSHRGSMSRREPETQDLSSSLSHLGIKGGSEPDRKGPTLSSGKSRSNSPQELDRQDLSSCLGPGVNKSSRNPNTQYPSSSSSHGSNKSSHEADKRNSTSSSSHQSRHDPRSGRGHYPRLRGGGTEPSTSNTNSIKGQPIKGRIVDGPRGRQFADTVDGRKWTRKAGSPWTEVIPLPKKEEELRLQFFLTIQKQVEGEPDHWSLFVGREGQPGHVYQVKGDATHMQYKHACGVNIFASSSIRASVPLNVDLTEEQHAIIAECAGKTTPPCARNIALAKKNCQTWYVEVLRKLRNGIVSANTVNDIQSRIYRNFR